MSATCRCSEIEITQEMLSAGIEAACLYNPIHDEFSIMLPAIFRAMLSAASDELPPRFAKDCPNSF